MAPDLSIGTPPRLHRVAHQNCHSASADQQRQGQTDGESLGSQKTDFPERHKRGSGGHHDRGNAGRNALLSPIHQAIVENKEQNREQRCGRPLDPLGERSPCAMLQP